MFKSVSLLLLGLFLTGCLATPPVKKKVMFNHPTNTEQQYHADHMECHKKKIAALPNGTINVPAYVPSPGAIVGGNMYSGFTEGARRQRYDKMVREAHEMQKRRYAAADQIAFSCMFSKGYTVN